MGKSPGISSSRESGGVTEGPRQRFVDGKRVEAAIENAMRNVRIMHRRMGIALVGSENGKIVTIPADQIEVENEKCEPGQ